MTLVMFVFFTSLFLLTGCNNNRTVTVSLVGDILLDRGVGIQMQKKGSNYPYKKTEGLLNKSDIVFGNLECPLTTKGIPILKNRNLIFRADPDCAKDLKNAGFDILNLANNHTMDYSHKGLENTINVLNNTGIITVGGGLNSKKARKPVYIRKHGMKIGFIGYSAFPHEGYFYSEKKPDVAILNPLTINNEIEKAKLNCDFLFVSLHWGKEFDYYPGQDQKQLAHMAVESGADAVIGHHPHVLQEIEYYKNKVILYSLGNFIFDSQIPFGTNETIIANIKITKDKPPEFEPAPVKILNCQPVPVDGERAKKILERIYPDRQ